MNLAKMMLELTINGRNPIAISPRIIHCKWWSFHLKNQFFRWKSKGGPHHDEWSVIGWRPSWEHHRTDVPASHGLPEGHWWELNLTHPMTDPAGAGRKMLTLLGYIDGIHGTPYIAAPWIRHGHIISLKRFPQPSSGLQVGFMDISRAPSRGILANTWPDS